MAVEQISAPEAPEEQIRMVLTQVALQGGNCGAARAVLVDTIEGFDLSASAIRRWKDEYPHVYFEVSEEVAELVNRRVAARSMDIADRAADGVELLVDRTITAAEDGEIPARDLARSARELSQVQSNSIEKSRLLRDRSTEIHKIEDMDSALEILEGLTAGAVESTAEPINDAELEP